jgi:hypothetical protein
MMGFLALRLGFFLVFKLDAFPQLAPKACAISDHHVQTLNTPDAVSWPQADQRGAIWNIVSASWPFAAASWSHWLNGAQKPLDDGHCLGLSAVRRSGVGSTARSHLQPVWKMHPSRECDGG